MILKNSKMKTKMIILSAGLVILVAGVSTFLSLSAIKKNNAKDSINILKQRIATLDMMLKKHGSDYRIKENKLTIGKYIIDGNNEYVDEIKEIFGGKATIFKGDLRVTTNIEKDDGSRAVGTRLKGKVRDVIFKDKKSYYGSAIILGKEYFTAYSPIFNPKKDVIGILFVGIKKDEFLNAYREIQKKQLIWTAILILLSVVLSIFVINKVTKELNFAIDIMEDMGRGNFSNDIHIEGNKNTEIGRLLLALGEFREMMHNMISNISQMLLRFSTSLKELTSMSNMFSNNSRTQAASSEEINATIEEILAQMENIAGSSAQEKESVDRLMATMGELSGIIEKTSETIKEAMSLANEMTSGAKEGEQHLSLMKSNMDKISKSSIRVNDIIKIINDISDRINLLSLNASIEAARAGDSGRGFAVVADEISKLAEETATQIKEINDLINTNMEEISGGNRTVEKSVMVIGNIIKKIADITEIISSLDSFKTKQIEANEEVNSEISMVQKMTDEIKIATEDQKAATSEIVTSINNISSSSQTIAAGSEEMNTSIEELADMAKTLKENTDEIKV